MDRGYKKRDNDLYFKGKSEARMSSVSKSTCLIIKEVEKRSFWLNKLKNARVVDILIPRLKSIYDEDNAIKVYNLLEIILKDMGNNSEEVREFIVSNPTLLLVNYRRLVLMLSLLHVGDLDRIILSDYTNLLYKGINVNKLYALCKKYEIDKNIDDFIDGFDSDKDVPKIPNSTLSALVVKYNLMLQDIKNNVNISMSLKK